MSMREEFLKLQVAPPAGAWIETTLSNHLSPHFSVAPPAGAWIETGKAIRGLKHKNVAPPAGAWIETAPLT